MSREFDLFTPGRRHLVAGAGSFVLPPLGNDGNRLLFHTTFSLDPLSSIVETPEQIFQLAGGGRGEATFLQEGRAWLFETARFDFQAVPEPSTTGWQRVGGLLVATPDRREAMSNCAVFGVS